MKPRYSVIVPVYNRPQEVADLVASLCEQTFRGFELILVEDGSTIPCRPQADEGKEKGLDVTYIYKENEGRSIARNVGMEHARGEYFVFFDSDCIIPSDYFEKLDRWLADHPCDCYGGPDAAHASFSDTQKAINHTMTSFLTTGGIRGGKVSLEKFVPRTFNMGFRREVYATVGGFREMFSEDIDMSTRIRNAGYTIALAADNPVWHKRRIDMAKFWRQVHVFGMSRITLHLLYPGSLKAVHALPAVFCLGCLVCLILAIAVSPWFLMFPIAYFLAVGVWGGIVTRSFKIGVLSVVAAAIQLLGYGTGFIRAYVYKILLRHGRDINQEIEMRRGK